MYRALVLFLAICLLSGCVASGKYGGRTIDDGIGGKKKMFYAYGQYCGPGHPPYKGEVGVDGQVRSLLSLYPPVDDVDALCYAHDYCYEIEEANELTCDSVFHSYTIDLQTELKEKGCWNLVTDLTIAFFYKNTARGENASWTFANRLVSTVVSVPFAAFWSVLKLPAKPFLAEAEEGTCNIGNISRPLEIVKEFERRYMDGLGNDEAVRIIIPLPET